MAKKKAAEAGVNKSQAIRDYKAANPDAGPTAIMNALAEQGVTVTTALVSNALTNAKKKTVKKKPGRPPKAAATADLPKRPGRPPKKGKKKGGRPKASSNGSDVNLNALIAAKKLSDEMGGVNAAKAALDALSKLM